MSDGLVSTTIARLDLAETGVNIAIPLVEVLMSTSIAGSRALSVFLFVVAAVLMTGCEAIGTIFKAGVWTGMIAVVVAITLVAFVALKMRS